MEPNPYEAPKEQGYRTPRPVDIILGMRRSFAIFAAIVSLAFISAVIAGCVFVVLAND